MRSSTLRSRPAWVALALIAGLVPAGMQIGAASATPVPTTTVEPQRDCAALAGTAVPASAIGLPTNGARVDSATLTAADGKGRPEFCLVRGHVDGADPEAPPINFQLNLPTQWNSKTMQMGGAGFNGFVVDGLGNIHGTGGGIGEAPQVASRSPPRRSIAGT